MAHPGKCFVTLLLSALLAYPIGCNTVSVALGGPGESRMDDSGGPPPWAPAHGYRAKHAYRYYPETEVYFDTGRGLWFYYQDGQWRAGANLPGGLSVEVGQHYVTLEMDTDRPYDHHPDVKKKYPPGQAKKKNKGKAKGKHKD